MPKFLSILLVRSSPFSCPITKTDLLSIKPKPVMTDSSSEKNRSPDNAVKLENIFFI